MERLEHTPVLLRECIEGLRIKPDGVYVDGTLGRGGHAREIMERLDSGRLIAIDRDYDAIMEARERLAEYEDRIDFVHSNFREIAMLLDSLNIDKADGMLFDLGIASPQIDNPERGFSYMSDAPLDMRMDRRDGTTAFDILNNRQEDDLRRIFSEYGEERYSGRIARAIVKKRAAGPINTTFDLNAIILSSIPPAARREMQHPSKRCFQALRIAVNDELGSVAHMLETAPDKLAPGGRICVICFHSLEDRIVKNSFLSRVNGCKCPSDLPACVCGFVPSLKLITRKPIIPGEEEAGQNHRSRSAKLRIAERI
ncbi:MAG: 16S rRNA (cytosine(1402)-N(4))-methyltransferase RsmH [Oscillospiraceae bacterium]|jgi:16S rRNA (cytosine1402-N4)-methyltransferase|nr:16S rRNA (cytosine(1402)-N(4))-methyltransferase RsmH [Oscillospiraceae bacterium]